MGLLEMFIGGLVGSYMNAKDEQKEWQRQQSEWEKIEPIFDNEWIMINVDELLGYIDIQIKYFYIEHAELYFMPIILPLFNLNPKGYQKEFICSLLLRHPFSYMRDLKALTVTSYNDCFQNNKLIQDISDIGLPDIDSYVWIKIFEEKEPWELDILKDTLKEIAWKFYHLNNVERPSDYSPSIKYPDNPLIEHYLSLIDLNFQLYTLNKK